jgi:K+-sensing histidine kinase KdpD
MENNISPSDCQPQTLTHIHTARTLHHVMGPLHALRGTCDVIRDRIDHQIQFGLSVNKDEDERNCRLLEQAADTVVTTTRMVADVSDLARFHEGANLKTKFRFINLRDVGLEAIKRIQFHALRLSGRDDGITVSVKLIGSGGPAVAYTDQATLHRVLAHLMENAVREVNSGGQVTLQITSLESNTLFEVLDNGKGLPPGTCLDQGSGFDTVAAPTIHRYALGGTSQGLSSNDPDEIQKVRVKMEEKLRDLKQNGVGAGLPLSYHLVRSLGGDLRHDSLYTGGTRIWFALPTQKDSNDTGDNEEVGDLLITETLFKKDAHPPTIITTTTTTTGELPERKRKKIEEPTFSNFSSDSGSTTSGDETTVTPPKSEEPAPAAVAKCGVKASLPFSVLVVEDTDICKCDM